MKSFYSIVRISPNINSGESVAVGLLLKTAGRLHFKYSENKKNISEKLLISDENIIDILLKQMCSKIDEVNSAIESSAMKLISKEDIFNPEYFDYLSKYSNGLIQFDSPKIIADEIDEEKFSNLYSLFIEKVSEDKKSTASEKSLIFKRNVEEKLVRRVEEKVHTNISFDSNIVSALYFKIEIDVIGRNGSIIGAKSIDFEKYKKTTLDTHLSHYHVFIDMLKDQFKGSNKDEFYLIADEPSEINSDEHRLWETVRKNKLFSIINSETADDVATAIDEANAKTFINFNE